MILGLCYDVDVIWACCNYSATESPLCEQCSADALQQLHVLPSGFHGVDAGGVHAGVTEDVRKTQQVLFHAVKNAGEQMPQRMGKDLARVHPRPLTQGFHAPPDRAAVQRRFVFREEHAAGGDAGLFHIAQQEPSQRGGNEDHAGFPLVADGGAALPHRLGGDVPQLGDADARAADGLHDNADLRPARGADKAGVFLAGELPFLTPEQRPLDAQGLHPAVGAAGKGQVAVDPRQHGVDTGGLVSLGQTRLVADGQLLGGLTPVQPAQEGAGVAQVLFYRGGAFLVFAQVLFKGLQLVHEIILRIIALELLYDMGVFFTRHTRLFSSFALPGISHAVLSVFFDYGIPPHGVAPVRFSCCSPSGKEGRREYRKAPPELLRRGFAFDHIKCHRQVWNTWEMWVTRC